MNEVSKNEKPAMENPVNNAAEAAAAAAPETPSPETAAAAAPESGKAHKKIHPGKAALAVVACLMLLLSTVTSGLYLYDRFYGYGGDEYGDFGPTKEDGVVIADEYTIESTLPISDAYKSGDTDKLDDRQKQVLEAASKVIDEVITDDMSDYEKECAIYEWIVKNVPFDEGMTTLIDQTPGQPAAGENSADSIDKETTVTSDGTDSGNADAGTPYGALIKHRAVCAGYATTFRMFMQMLDIECMVVHSSDCVHSWDLVKIDDHWYHVDIYSDVDSALYGNFNLNDDMMMQDWDREYFPAADSLAANPAYKDRITCKSVYEIPGIVRKAMEAHSGRVFVEFEDTPSAEDQQLATFMVNAISMDLDYNNSLRASVFGGTWLPTGEENEMRLFSVEIMYMDDEQTNTDAAAGKFDEQTREKATRALQDAFGDLSDYIRIEDGVY